MSLGRLSPPAEAGAGGISDGRDRELACSRVAVPEMLSVTRKLPNHRQNTPAVTDSPWFSSCCAATASSQLYGRLPQPYRASSCTAAAGRSTLVVEVRVHAHGGVAGVHLVVDAGLRRPLGGVSGQVAVGDEVAVVVDPVPRRRELDVVGTLRGQAAERLPEHVLAVVHLQRRAAVAEQVVGRGNLRRPVLVLGGLDTWARRSCGSASAATARGGSSGSPSRTSRTAGRR